MEQKKFDYNSFIGMLLLGGIMILYFMINQKFTDRIFKK